MCVLLVVGASGGHVYPACALAESILEDREDADVFGLSRNMFSFPLVRRMHLGGRFSACPDEV